MLSFLYDFMFFVSFLLLPPSPPRIYLFSILPQRILSVFCRLLSSLLDFLCYSPAPYTLLPTLMPLLLFMFLLLLLLPLLLVPLCVTSRRMRSNHSAPSVQCKLRHLVFSMCVFSLYSFWPAEFSCGRLEASLWYSDTDSWLADAVRQTPSPCHVTYTVGPSASSSGFITGLNLTTGVYQRLLCFS